MDEHRIQRAMEQIGVHLARADSELEAALRFLDPRTDDDDEMLATVRTRSARTSVGDDLETIRAQLRE
jgi:hypothetical protein